MMNDVPDYYAYMSYEELEEGTQKLVRDHRSTVEMISAGNSEHGRPINALKIGTGRHKILLYGFPNPEEPLGGLVLEYLSHRLATDENLLKEMDCTWYIIKCIDPDGSKLTEAYFKGPLTPLNFSKNFYRTPNRVAGELNFPFRFGSLINANTPTRETLALIKLMNGVKFDFISSLHIMKFGEMTFEVSRPCPEIYSELQRTARDNGIPLRKRIGDIVAPGIQLAHYMTPAANYVTKKMLGLSQLQEVTGCFSFEYARMLNPNLFMMIPECTTWFDPRCYDDRPSGFKLKDTVDYVRSSFAESTKLISECFDSVRPLVNHSSPYYIMLDEIVSDIKYPKIGVLDPDPTIRDEELEKETTLSQKISTEGRADIYRMFNLGTLLRMIDLETIASGINHQLNAVRERLDGAMEQFSANLATKYEVKHYPLRNLVAMNVSSLLVSIEYAKRNAVDAEIYPN